MVHFELLDIVSEIDKVLCTECVIWRDELSGRARERARMERRTVVDRDGLLDFHWSWLLLLLV